jgi:hypothetical protein
MAVLGEPPIRPPRPAFNRTALFRLALVAVGLALAAAPARGNAAREYQIKAVFLFNFAEFVEWPADAFADTKSPLVIGILGEDPFGQAMDEAVRGERVNNRPLVVRRYGRVEDVTTCHILFISHSERGRTNRILGELRGRSILTVSDMDQFTRQGGIIRFVTENSRVRFRINVEAARKANLTISSKLLRPAEIVTAADQ